MDRMSPSASLVSRTFISGSSPASSLHAAIRYILMSLPLVLHASGVPSSAAPLPLSSLQFVVQQGLTAGIARMQPSFSSILKRCICCATQTRQDRCLGESRNQQDGTIPPPSLSPLPSDSPPPHVQRFNPKGHRRVLYRHAAAWPGVRSHAVHPGFICFNHSQQGAGAGVPDGHSPETRVPK